MARALLIAILLVLVAAAPAAAVVGGRPASEPYPFVGSLQVDGEHICGASLLAPDRVLTAAHCVHGERAANLTVVLGREDLATKTGTEHRVAAVEVHPRYDPDVSEGYDVAVLRLAEPSPLAAIRLAGPDEAHLWEAGDPARVLGWGDAVFAVGLSPSELHEVDVPIVSDRECRRLNRAQFDERTMVCAGEDEGLRDSCQGDSGGPLIVRGRGEWLQVGTVSLGTGCGIPLFYGVYGRVAADPLHSWIREAAGLNVPPRTEPDPEPSPDPGPEPEPEPAARVRVSRDLGSARAARRRGALRLRLRATAPVSSVRVTLRRGSRVVARGRRAQLRGEGMVRLAVRRVQPGRMKVVVRAVDAAGRPVRARATVRVRR